MTPSQVYDFCNSFALSGWILMIFFPKWEWTPRIILGITVVILGLLYSYFLLNSFSFEMFESFGSLAGIMALFTSPEAVLAGWIHYLAFDMVAGWFILSDSQKNKINHLLIIPCLLLTFMMGPIGFLLYIVVRSLTTKQYFFNYSSL